MINRQNDIKYSVYTLRKSFGTNHTTGKYHLKGNGTNYNLKLLLTKEAISKSR